MERDYPLDDRVGFPTFAETDRLLCLDENENDDLGIDSDEEPNLPEGRPVEEEQVNGISLKIGIFLTRWPHKYHPGSVILIEALLVLFAISVYCCARYHPPTDFINDMKSDPELGFSTRGTEVVKGQWTAKKLYEHVVWHPTGKYSPYPNKTLALVKLGLSPSDYAGWLTDAPAVPTLPLSKPPSTTPQPGLSSTATPAGTYRPLGNWLGYVLFAFEPRGPQVDLWAASKIREVCHVVKHQLLPKLHTSMHQVYSLGTVIGNVYDKDCQDLTKNDVKNFQKLFQTCIDYGIPTEEDAHQIITPTVPPPEVCTTFQWQMHDTKRYLLPEKSTKDANAVKRRLGTTMVFIDTFLPKNDATGFYNDHLFGQKIQSEHVAVTGFRCQDKDLKLHVYEEYMMTDTYLFGLAIGFVFVIMFAYLRRVDVLFATILMILMSCVFSYTVFYFVLGMEFFPAINLLAILIIIAVGSDDVFVFYDLFEQTQRENKDKPLEVILAKTLNHAVLSLFVTSLTTSAAFYSNAVSNISNIKIFGIFAGTSILVNFVTMILFIPSVVAVMELILGSCPQRCAVFDKCSEVCTKKLSAMSSYIFGYLLPKFVEKCWHVCIILLTILGMGSFFLVFVKPGFQLPYSDDFQVFESSNMLEHWDLILSAKYLFTQQKYDYKLLHPFYIFGFKAQDPGNHLNPKDDSGELIEDEAFNLYDDRTQLWMQKTCHKFQQAPFAKTDYMDSFDCAFDAYETVVSNLCSNPIYGAVLHKCCESKTAPFKNLDVCLPVYQALAHNKLDLPFMPKYPKPILDVVIFHPHTNEAVGYVLNIKTHWYNSYNYKTMGHYYSRSKAFFQEQLDDGPKTVQGGFVAYMSFMWFWDLQNALYSGTYYSILMSLAVSAVVMLATSLNLLITIYAMITISMAIISTVAAIVLMGWSLSVIESVIISLSVGLSIDFTIHYGVAYRLSKKLTPTERVQESFKTVGAAVAMAALTTFTSGAALMLCRVLPYIKLGIFLMLVMTLAWVYATFMFQSICRIIGPKGNFCQLRIPWDRCKNKCKTSEDRADVDYSSYSRIRLAQVDLDDELLTV